MKKGFLQTGLFGLLFAAVIVGFATNRTPKKNPSSPKIYSFYYYPKPNIYYNRTEHTYIFPDKDGNWQTAEHVPYSSDLSLDKKVALEARSSNIWQDNDRHRMIYAVSLYASASDFKERPQKKLVPTITPANDSAIIQKESKKESSVKRFFKKIFRKKRDRQDSNALN